MNKLFDENFRIIVSVLAIVLLLFVLYAFLIEKNEQLNKERAVCLSYGDKALDEMPAKCIRYYK